MLRHGFRRHPVSTALLGAGLLGLSLTACGGSSHPARPTSKPQPPSGAQAKGPTSASGSSSVATGPVHARLKATTHRPVARKDWTYTVTAADAHGRPLSGIVETDFAFQGSVVGHETPRIHKLKHGRLRDTFQFPTRAIGYPIELQVVVHTTAGSVTLDWPVTVLR